MAAIVVEPNSSRLVSKMISRSFFGVPDHDAAQQFRVVGLGAGAGQADELVGANISIGRDLAFLDHFESGILLQAGDEEDPAVLQRANRA